MLTCERAPDFGDRRVAHAVQIQAPPGDRDVANGARFETYALAGPRRSGTVCVNGAAARLVHPGDLIIVITYAAFSPEEAAGHRPVIVLLNADNSIRDRITADQARDAEFLADG